MSTLGGVVAGLIILGVVGLALVAVLRTLGVLPIAKVASTSTPGKAGKRMGQQAAYENLATAGSGLRGYGVTLKIIGAAVVVVGLVGGFVSGNWNLGFGVGVGTVGIVMGLLLHAAGAFFAAFGEAFIALKDIALNTARTANSMVSRSNQPKTEGQSPSK